MGLKKIHMEGKTTVNANEHLIKMRLCFSREDVRSMVFHTEKLTSLESGKNGVETLDETSHCKEAIPTSIRRSR